MVIFDQKNEKSVRVYLIGSGEYWGEIIIDDVSKDFFNYVETHDSEYLISLNEGSFERWIDIRSMGEKLGSGSYFKITTKWNLIKYEGLRPLSNLPLDDLWYSQLYCNGSKPNPLIVNMLSDKVLVTFRHTNKNRIDVFLKGEYWGFILDELESGFKALYDFEGIKKEPLYILPWPPSNKLFDIILYSETPYQPGIHVSIDEGYYFEEKNYNKREINCARSNLVKIISDMDNYREIPFKFIPVKNCLNE